MRSRGIKLIGGLRWAGALAVALGATAMGIALAAPPAVTQPTILTHPAAVTNHTSAAFTYSDTQAGVTYQCELDAGSYVACPSSGTSYAGPLAQGTHTFAVRAASGTKTSTPTTFSWLVDVTAPATRINFPAGGGLYSASAYNEGCSGGAGICGKAKDAHGVASVAVSIQRAGGSWWGGSGFNKTAETFNAATVEGSGSEVGWRYPLGLPADGSYVVHVRATDEAGNVTAAESEASATFTIDTTPPPVPSITSGPDAETASKSATFTFTDGEAGATLLCARDERTFFPCTSPKTYDGNQVGEHLVMVEARDAAGNVSAAASYAWTVIKGMIVEGNLAGQLAPGVTRPFALTLTNPNSKPVMITSLSVTAGEQSSQPGCDAATNLQIIQSNASESNPATVPGRGKLTLPSGSVTAPQVLMKNLQTNQDACKGATFTFTYADSGHS